jgi:serine phosphatase RsbU (regulator of sigma subunit)
VKTGSDSLSQPGLSAHCFLKNEAIFIQDFEKEFSQYLQEYPQYPDRPTNQSLIYLPLRAKDQTIGVITAQHPNKKAFERRSLDILDALGAYVAIALENSTAYNTIKEKNSQITDSIRYAQTIQRGVLRDPHELNNYFKDSFIFYKPKDVVSGDFYWFKRKEGRVYVAVADCTGHGVPGAFMSLIGLSMLENIINTTSSPSLILEHLHESVVKTLRQAEEGGANNDGMDISVCVFEEGRMIFAGAKRPVVLLSGGRAQIIKGSARGIGGWSMRDTAFEENEVPLAPGDTVYLFSDGYTDQCNGPRIKFGTARLLELLGRMGTTPLHEQPQVLERVLQQYQEHTAQRDDITVLGIRV